jgi:hypothetical protein
VAIVSRILIYNSGVSIKRKESKKRRMVKIEFDFAQHTGMVVWIGFT